MSRHRAPSGQAVEAAALARQLFAAGLATAELLNVYVGLRLGLYEALGHAPRTPPQLAAEAGIAPRYAREWLEQQAVAGVLRVSGWERDADGRLYRLPKGHREALLDRTSRHAIAPLALLPVGAMGRVLPLLLEAFRSGDGVPPAVYGGDLQGTADGLNRPVFTHDLAGWITSMLPDVHARLRAPGARVVDVACGTGWSTIALAHAYPTARIEGLDLDAGALRHARANARREGVGERASFRRHDAARPDDDPGTSCVLVCVFDALHDMPQPVAVLEACRRRLAPGGCVLLMEPRVAASFSAPGDEVERLMYAISVLHCLPVGLSGRPSEGTGTVMREATVGDYARRAGFATTTVLAAEHRFHRLYRLDP